jgi:hypothetical protein
LNGGLEIIEKKHQSPPEQTEGNYQDGQDFKPKAFSDFFKIRQAHKIPPF